MPRELVTTEQIVLGTLRCELTEPPRTNSPQGDLQARWFRVVFCIGTSWRFAKEPRRFLCRFFALFLLAEERAILYPRRGGDVIYRRLITACSQKAVGLLD